MRKETGGPAFPFECVTSRTGLPMDWTNYKGMTLRDYFAAKAMASLIIWDENDNMSYEKIAEHAYMCADAMLKERDK